MALVVLAVVLLLAKASSASSETVLHSFSPQPKGTNPEAGLIADAAGNLYGTTASGGASGCGTVFKLTPKPAGGWKETVLYSFSISNDGCSPVAAVTFDTAGNLYGTTQYGGGSLVCEYQQGCGAVFELSPGRNGIWNERVLYAFQDEGDGTSPTASVVIDQAGNLFGTTQQGGGADGNGFGTVFELTPGSNGQWTKSSPYVFSGSSDGATPVGVILDASGNLYGATYTWGPQGYGTIYELSPQSGGNWSFKILHGFSGSDGAFPAAALLLDSAGNLYGTTQKGPGVACAYTGCGVVFEMSPQSGGKWSFQDLYVFEGGPDGASPMGALILDNLGDLYGTTQTGGDLVGFACNDNDYECGTVFELVPGSGNTWTEQVLHRFHVPVAGAGGPSSPVGYAPVSGLILDKAGNLYGTDPLGGLGFADGTVFELARNGQGRWIPKVVNAFGSRLDGTTPSAGLISGGTGTFYGTTATGESGNCNVWHSEGGCGTVFEISQTKQGWKEKVLHKFGGTTDGAVPMASLIRDESGSLYGTTTAGGQPCSAFTPPGCGTAFKLTPTKGGWKESVLYRFAGGSDGALPSAGLIMDEAGDFYGVTAYGGGCTGIRNGCGTVFELIPAGRGWTEKILYSFQGGTDGAYPFGPLLFDDAGNIYGTASWDGPYGCGTVFRLSPGSGNTWKETVLYGFTYQQGDGCAPMGNLAFDSHGSLFGATSQGGDTSGECYYQGCGIVFELTLNSGSWVESVIDVFNGEEDGNYPIAGVSLDSMDNVYVAVNAGGNYGRGTLVELTPAGNGSWNESVVYDFAGIDGAYPGGPVILDTAGNLYGTTTGGGTAGEGAVFEVSPGQNLRSSTKHSLVQEGNRLSPHRRLRVTPPGQRLGLGPLRAGDVQ